tara:strand:+ start:5900 stop:6868 length:969 start_codon:yes stop_codon:yes gene_type:complete
MTYLSIIIPIYNTEHFLPECIESCLKLESTFNDFEIILVDDGSTDKSLSICNYYKNIYPNIKVLSQENQKQGAARNNGLNIAKGKYIWFVDSDDLIQTEGFLKLLKELKKGVYDILCFNGKEIDENGDFLKDFNRFDKNSINCKFSLISSKSNYHSCAPLYLLKKSFLEKNNLKFLPNIFFEDTEFLIRVFDSAPKTITFEDSLYTIRLSSNSTTRTLEYERFFDLFNTTNTLISIRKKQNNEDDISMIDILLFRNINSILTFTMPSKKMFYKACSKIREYEEINTIISPKKSMLNTIQIRLLNKPYILRALMILFYNFKHV